MSTAGSRGRCSRERISAGSTGMGRTAVRPCVFHECLTLPLHPMSKEMRDVGSSREAGCTPTLTLPRALHHMCRLHQKSVFRANLQEDSGIKDLITLARPTTVVTHATKNGNQFAFIHARTGCSNSYSRRSPLGVKARALACCRMPCVLLTGSKCPESTSASTYALTIPSYSILSSEYKLNNRSDASEWLLPKYPILP